MNAVINTTQIAVPVSRDCGIDSPVSGHFGKAPGFVIVDSEGKAACYCRSKEIRGASECAPIDELNKLGVQLVVARSMGRGALRRCHEAGFKILRSEATTVAGVVDAYRNGLCMDFPDTAICDHHGEHAHSHRQDKYCSSYD